MDINVNSSKKANLDLNTLLILYQHYKAYFLPLGIIIASVLVFIIIVIPGIQQYLNSRQELKIETEKLKVLTNNYNFLTSIDDTKADNDLNILSRALPTTKDFAGILNAISAASSKTGVSIGEFEFSVGDLKSASIGVAANPSIRIDINVVGSPDLIINLINQLYKTVPLSDVIAIKINGNFATLTLLFYYKAFPLADIKDDSPIIPFSTKTTSLIQEISTWNNATVQTFIPEIPNIDSTQSGTIISSSSGVNTSPF